MTKDHMNTYIWGVGWPTSSFFSGVYEVLPLILAFLRTFNYFCRNSRLGGPDLPLLQKPECSFYQPIRGGYFNDFEIHLWREIQSRDKAIVYARENSIKRGRRSLRVDRLS